MRRGPPSLLLAAFMLAACTSRAPTVSPEPPLVWPAAPEPPRIAFVQAFSRAEDLGIRRGLWQRFGDLLFGVKDLGIVRPMAVVEAGGVLYVADPGARGVHRFDRLNGRHDLIVRAGKQSLPSPVGLARGSAGEIYVSDSALRKVFMIRAQSQVAEEVQLGTELRQPTGIAVDPASGRLFVVDTGTHRVQVFERDGTLAASIGERGVGPAQFNYPTLLWRDATGRLYVTDSLNFRVQILDPQGRFVAQFGRHGDGTGDLARHKGVATDSRGHVYVVDGLLHALQIFDASGRLLLAIGAQGREPGEFWLPVGIFIGEGDMIYVADAYNRRVQVFRYIGGAT